MEKKVKILLVDDRESNLLALSSILTDADYELVYAHDGRQALKAILKYEFAVILMDVVMPDIDGFEVARVVQQLHTTRFTPIIFVTAEAQEMDDIYKGYS